MDRALADLRASGFPIDWRTIYVGWQGVETCTVATFRLTGNAVAEHAREVLADAAGTPDEYPVFLLADAAPGDWQMMERELSRLAERSDASPERSLRIWRYAHLLRAEHRLRSADGRDIADRLQIVIDATFDWGELVSERPLTLGWWYPETEENLAEVTGLLRRWLDEERRELLGD
jgi:hypothetical protein